MLNVLSSQPLATALLAVSALAACGGGGSAAGGATESGGQQAASTSGAGASVAADDVSGGTASESRATALAASADTPFTVAQLKTCSYGQWGSWGYLEGENQVPGMFGCLTGRIDGRLHVLDGFGEFKETQQSCRVSMAPGSATMTVGNTAYTASYSPYASYNHFMRQDGSEQIFAGKRWTSDPEDDPSFAAYEVDFYKDEGNLKQWSLNVNVKHTGLPDGYASCRTTISDPAPVPAAQPLTYSQVSQCPQSISPLSPGKLSCLKGYVYGQTYTRLPGATTETITNQHDCVIAVMGDGSLIANWRFVDDGNSWPGEFETFALNQSAFKKQTPGGGLAWANSSFSTEWNNARSRRSHFDSVTGFNAGADKTADGLYMLIDEDKQRRQITIKAQTHQAPGQPANVCVATLN